MPDEIHKTETGLLHNNRPLCYFVLVLLILPFLFCFIFTYFTVPKLVEITFDWLYRDLFRE